MGVAEAHDTFTTAGERQGGAATVHDAPPTASGSQPPTAPAPPTPAQAPRRSTTRRALDIGVVVALLSLVFGAVTYLIDRQGQDRADQRQARSELTGLIREITALPLKYYDLTTSSDPLEAEAASSLQTTELQTMVAQGQRIIDRYPEIAEAADLYTVGATDVELQNFGEALDNLDSAEEKAVADQNYLLTTAVRRTKGYAYYLLTDWESGRREFRRAMSLQGLEPAPEWITVGHQSVTYDMWIRTALEVGSCDEAAQLLADYDTLLREEKVVTGTVTFEALRRSVESCGQTSSQRPGDT